MYIAYVWAQAITWASPDLLHCRFPVMVCPLVLHDLPKPHLHLQQLDPFPMLLDWPPTQPGHQPTSHSLSQTLVCFCYLSLLDSLNSPCCKGNHISSFLGSSILSPLCSDPFLICLFIIVPPWALELHI